MSSFASRVKNEICRQEPEDICCARAELAGIFCFAAQIGGLSLKIKTENADVAKRIQQLVKHLYNLGMEAHRSESGIYTVQMKDIEVIKMLRDMCLADVPMRIDNKIVRGDCCRRSFVRGAFLGSGSISDPLKSYHAEFVTGRYALCGDFGEILRCFGIAPGIIKRNGNYVFYIKDSGQIEDLLAVLGAHTQMMEMLNIKIEKEVRNDTNRRVNCENANSEKRAEAAVLQKHAILLLDKTIGLDNLPPRLAEVARMRLENPEASLADIAAEMGITKSGINHRMRRLIQMAEERKKDK